MKITPAQAASLALVRKVLLRFDKRTWPFCTVHIQKQMVVNGHALSIIAVGDRQKAGLEPQRRPSNADLLVVRDAFYDTLKREPRGSEPDAVAFVPASFVKVSGGPRRVLFIIGHKSSGNLPTDEALKRFRKLFCDLIGPKGWAVQSQAGAYKRGK